MKSQSIRFHSFGKAGDVCQLEEVNISKPAEGELLVKMLAAPINPADLNFIQGNYGIRPELPTSPGIEGCGEVIESAAEGFHVGDRVIFIERVGTWQRHVMCSADKVIVIPQDITVTQAAMLKVNPATAWCLLHAYTDLKPGDWVIQNAANSGVGQCVIQIAKQLGLRTINVVRREGLDNELQILGADKVLLDDNSLTEKVKNICGDNLPRLACNAVGGDSALRLMDALAEHGTHVTYGAMSMRSLKVPNKFLIFKGINLQGLWITKWIAATPQKERERIYQQLAAWVKDGKLSQAVDSVFTADNLSEALVRASEGKRHGKVLLEL